MKKPNTMEWSHRIIPKFDLKMKFSLLFLVISFFQMHANSAYSQKTKISLDLKNATLTEVFTEIESKTKFKFFYKNKEVDLNRKVTIKTKKKPIGTILKVLFQNTDIIFHVQDKQIVINKTVVAPKRNETEAISQNPIRVTGKVTDEKGNPLIGATIRIRDTNTGVVTNFDGDYKITVPNGNSILIFTNVGFATQKITVGNQITINVTLKEAVNELDEVVLNAGYYKISQRKATGNISKVEARDIELQPVTNPLQAIQGRMAGVSIVQRSGVPGAAIDIQIRGRNSLRSEGNDALFVIDGIPYPSNSLVNRGIIGSALFGGNPLALINPNDIASVQVLKDADATAIYGSLGANGVVLITTKKGKVGKARVDFSMSTGFGQVIDKVKLLNPEQYVELVTEGVVNSGFDNLPIATLERVLPDIYLWDPTRNTDWQEELLGGTAEQTNANISISGGNQDTQFNFGAGYFKETTVFPLDEGFKRVSGRLSINHTSTNKRFQFSASVNYTNTQNTLPSDDLTRAALSLAPHAPNLYDENGNINWEPNFNDNPVATIQRPYSDEQENLLANFSIGFNVFEGLRLSAEMLYNSQQLDANQIVPLNTIRPAYRVFQGRRSLFRIGSNKSWSIEPKIEYSKRFNKLTLNMLAGGTFRADTNESETLSASGFSNDAFLLNKNAATLVDVATLIFAEYRYNAVYARLNLDWDDKYILNLTGRRDGSSRFGPNKKFGNFGAVGATWIFSEENIFKNKASFLSFGKLRASYGIVGSDQIGNYEYLDAYKFVDNPYNDVLGLEISRLANPNFSWESVKKLEVAFELGFFESRFNPTVSWYRNRASDQLVGLPLSSVTGDTSLQFNLPAVVENRGWEFVVNSMNINSKNFSWTTNFNISFPENELLEFPGIENFPRYKYTWVIGESINGRSRKYYEFKGLNSNTGLYEFTDVNNDGAISFGDDNKNYIEVGQQFFGGIQNSLRYKSVELDFNFQFVKQNGFNHFYLAGQPGTRGNKPVEFLDRWQQPGDQTQFERASYRFSPSNNNRNFSDALIEDTSYIRLNNLSLAYNLPSKVLREMNIQKLRVFFQGQNLFTITKFKGLNPEVAGIGSSIPPLRFLSLGLQATF